MYQADRIGKSHCILADGGGLTSASVEYLHRLKRQRLEMSFFGCEYYSHPHIEGQLTNEHTKSGQMRAIIRKDSRGFSFPKFR